MAQEWHCASRPKGLLFLSFCWLQPNTFFFKGDYSGSCVYGSYSILQGAKVTNTGDKYSKHGFLLSSGFELLKNCRETAAGELSKWKAFNVCVLCCSFWTHLPHISDTHLRILVLTVFRQSECRSPLQGKLICGEILTENGCHESPEQTDRLLTDEVPPLLSHLHFHILTCLTLWRPPLWFQS